MRSRPDELTNADIQKLGDDYLIEFGKQTAIGKLFHSNHAIAKQLSGYMEYNDYTEKWRFLTTIYAQLPNNNGVLDGGRFRRRPTNMAGSTSSEARARSC